MIDQFRTAGQDVARTDSQKREAILARNGLIERVGYLTARYSEDDAATVRECIGIVASVGKEAAESVMDSLSEREGGEAAGMSRWYIRMASYSKNGRLLVSSAGLTRNSNGNTALLVLDAVDKVLYRNGVKHAQATVNHMKVIDPAKLTELLNGLAESAYGKQNFPVEIERAVQVASIRHKKRERR